AWSTPTTPISRPSAIASVDVADWAVPPPDDEQRLLRHHQPVVITKNQSQTTCEEDKDNRWHASATRTARRATCTCWAGGVKTGRCVRSSREANLTISARFYGCADDHVKNFTVLIKNSVEFPKFGVKTPQHSHQDDQPLSEDLNYRPNHPEDRYCPIFKLGDIIKYGQAISEKASQADLDHWGGMVAIDIHWSATSTTTRSTASPNTNSAISRMEKLARAGIFGRGIHKRTLVKAFGIQFFISVTGRGGKFDILNFTMNLDPGWLCSRWLRCCEAQGDRRARQAPSEKATGVAGAAASAIDLAAPPNRRRQEPWDRPPASHGHLSTPQLRHRYAVSGADLSDISALRVAAAAAAATMRIPFAFGHAGGRLGRRRPPPPRARVRAGRLLNRRAQTPPQPRCSDSQFVPGDRHQRRRGLPSASRPATGGPSDPSDSASESTRIGRRGIEGRGGGPMRRPMRRRGACCDGRRLPAAQQPQHRWCSSGVPAKD
uniref:DUF1336 domain-containing protein n=1 Tax=Macrostomum lignano TaxID=282301 RepID=A0A1I8JS23_9PLAT